MALVNGNPDSTLGVDDRGLLYGDGLFETLAVRHGRPCLWQRHLARLRHGAERLRIPMPDLRQLRHEAEQLVGPCQSGVLKIILTRGVSGRGYRPPDDARPTRIVTFADTPRYHADIMTRGAHLRICKTRLGSNPSLAGMKTLNRLEQVLARDEWSDPEIDEGLMCDSEGNLIEGTMSNLFLLRGGVLLTPDLSACGVAGVMRGVVLDLAPRLGLSPRIEKITLQDLASADALFVTNSLIGLWPVSVVDGLKFDCRALSESMIRMVMKEGFEA